MNYGSLHFQPCPQRCHSLLTVALHPGQCLPNSDSTATSYLRMGAPPRDLLHHGAIKPITSPGRHPSSKARGRITRKNSSGAWRPGKAPSTQDRREHACMHKYVCMKSQCAQVLSSGNAKEKAGGEKNGSVLVQHRSVSAFF